MGWIQLWSTTLYMFCLMKGYLNLKSALWILLCVWLSKVNWIDLESMGLQSLDCDAQ